ncbi:MAG: thioredoxin [Candidatus Micrarchaeota archaeon]|nr:thioredoxin [Candidatus Micrarchaeota archaeon]
MEIEITDATFAKDVIEASKEKAVVVDFWAPWCGPCRMISPILESMANQRDDFVLAKMNVDENPQTTMLFGIMSIPTIKMFKDGKVADEFIGALPEFAVKEWFEKNLGKKE